MRFNKTMKKEEENSSPPANKEIMKSQIRSDVEQRGDKTKKGAAVGFKGNFSPNKQPSMIGQDERSVYSKAKSTYSKRQLRVKGRTVKLKSSSTRRIEATNAFDSDQENKSKKGGSK